MKVINGLILALLLLAIGLMCGCGHQPMGPVAVFGQVEHYSVHNTYHKGAFCITITPQNPAVSTDGVNKKSKTIDENGLPILGHSFGNGAIVIAPGALITGYAGSKTPQNEQTATVTPAP